MIFPVIGQLVARFLPFHALLNPFAAAPVFPPIFTRPIERSFGVSYFLHPLIAHFGQPQLDRLGLGAGDGLNQAQQCFGIGGVGQIFFAISRFQFQSVTICHRLTPLFFKPLFQLVPVFSGRLKIRLIEQCLNDVHHGKIPCFSDFIINAPDFVLFENS